jgi:beta-lactamase regulating signal transducer with metallopeptidase domain
MTSLFTIGVTNALVATALAFIVWCVTRVWRQPALAQLLWVLVLVKLVTPPLVAIPWPVERDAIVSLPAETQTDTDQEYIGPVAFTNAQAATSPPANRPTTAEPATIPLSPAPHPEVVSKTKNSIEHVRQHDIVSREPLHWIPMLTTAWLIGSTIWLSIAMVRLTRFHRALRHTVSCPDNVFCWASEAAAKLEVTSRFRLRMTDARLSPLVWPIGRPTILLSRPLLNELSPEETKTLLAHELAHLRRKDHWLRWLELFVTAIYWWHPVVWWSRYMIQIAEEQSCDAWVVWAFPDSAKRYASALFKTVQMASDHRPRVPQAASRLGSAGDLKERIEDIMNAKWKCRLTPRARVVIVLVTISILPLSLRAVTAAGEQAAEPQVQSAATSEDHNGKPVSSNKDSSNGQPFPSKSADAPATRPQIRIPTSPYYVAAGDVLNVTVSNAFADQPIADDFLVEPGGTIALGPAYGRAKVGGLTLEDADRAVTKHLAEFIHDPVVQVTIGGWRNHVGPWTGRPDQASNNSRMVNDNEESLAAASANGANPQRSSSPAELDAMREHVKFLDERFKSVEALYQTSSRGGSADSRARTGYELAAAQADLAIAEGHREQAVAYCEQAEKYAEEALKAVTASYDSGRVSLDLLLQTAKFASESKRHLIRVREPQLTSAEPPQQTVDNRSALKRELARQSSFSETNTSVSVWKKLTASRKQGYERMKLLADKKVVPAADLEMAKTDYEVCVAQYEHTFRTLKYAQLLVSLAETDYEEALAKNKAAPHSVSEFELKKLQIKVDLAKVKASEIE